MKILFLTESFLPYRSGVVTSTLTIASGLANMGYNIYILAPKYEAFSFPELHPNIRIIGLPSLRNPFKSNHRYSNPLFSQIDRVLSSLNPDVIHIQGLTFLFLSTRSWAQKHQCPLLITHHSPPEFITKFSRILATPRIEQKANQIVIRFSAWLYNRADYVTTPTKTMKNLLVQTGVSTPIEVISNGVDIKWFCSAPKTSKVKHDLPIIFYLGRLDPDKSLEVLLEAFINYVDFPSQLIIAGEGSDLHRLQKIANRSTKKELIHFPGFVPDDDLVLLYQKSSVFVNPSTAEAQSIAALQAAACGLPLVLADAQALPELIKNNGYLHKPNDPKDLGRLIDLLLRSPKSRKKLGNAGRELAMKHDSSATIKKYKNLYQKLALPLNKLQMKN